jgi:hypothetical protein
MIWQCFKLFLPPGTRLTSVRRSADDQLALIVRRAKDKGYIFKRQPTVEDESSWLEAWQLVNTPSNPIARPGRSMHQKGLAYDLSGPNLGTIFGAVKRAAQWGRIRLIRPRVGWENPRLEGGCVHVEIDGGKLDFEPFDYV